MSKKEQQEPVEGELVPVEREAQPSEIATASIYGTMTVGQLKKATVKMAEQRAVITEYVSGQLVEGVDYGKIHIKKDCPNKYTPQNCKVGGHFSKSVLFKPGQEKIFSLFNLTAKLYRDVETLEMLGKPDGLVALICKVYRGDVEIAEGRGAAKIGDNSRDANATIKIAEKRARMDACLSLGFSEFFTQDIEDPEYRARLEGESDSAGAGGGDAPAAYPASQKQKDFIVSLMQQEGIANNQMAAVCAANGIANPKEISKDQASDLIGKLKEGTYLRPAEGRPATIDGDGVYRDEDGHPDVTTPEGDAAAALAEEGQIVDVDDLSQEAIERGLDNAINNIKADEPF